MRDCSRVGSYPQVAQVPQQTKQILNSIPSLIEKTFPVPARFRASLPSQVAELSRLLTNSRGERSLSYLSRPGYLSAYLHYFLPWNLYRLCLLLPTLEIKLSAGNTITDLGCGPLTFVSALWITRPDLRAVPLEFNCIDRVPAALEAGKKFFNALADSENIPWKINLVKKEINIQKSALKQKFGQSSLVCAVNIFNEIYESIPHSNTEKLRRLAANAAQFMHNEAAENASILAVEPGVPQSGKFISYLRAAFMELGRFPAAPCPHTAACPLLPAKWCHFGFEAEDAPKDLRRLSAAAKIPKERLVFSFLLTGAENKKSEDIRVLSDAFPLPNCREALPLGKAGRYGCSAQGLVLLAGEKTRVDNLKAYSLISYNNFVKQGIDKKSGALILELK
ncbi:MAG: small ribosomal subunit Rsm22 family protein [Treponema sp.]|nr:small ribosomal subunit Rsm22 family protein [Treponema sp.]